MLRRLTTTFAMALLATASLANAARAADLRIAIVQAQAGEARQYQALLDYLRARGIPATFVTAQDYASAARMFASGSVDAMFGGSGIAATMMIKGLAEPLVRAVGVDGVSTYSAVVIGPKGSPRFAGKASFFDGKRVIFSALASGGEFYFQSLGKCAPAARLKAASHGAALDALSRGAADYAVVKNHVWTREQARYPTLERLGGDDGENPDGSLIVSRKVEAARAQAVSAAMLALEADGSPAARAARGALKIRGYVPAVAKDFAHTLEMLKRAGVTKDFAFRF